MEVPDLDVVDDDALRLQQEPKLGHIDPLERSFKVLVPIAILRVRKYHECGIGALESHIQHSLDNDTIALESLLL